MIETPSTPRLKPGRPRLLLFDVDGTLLLSHGGSLRAMTAAGERVFGRGFDLEPVDRNGRLDPQILAAALEHSRIEATDDEIAVFRRQYIVQLRAEVAATRMLPGVRDLLADLRSVDDVVLGLVTGNYKEAALLKLLAAEIDPAWFAAGGFGEEAATREALVHRTMEQAARRLGRSMEPADVIVIGDTPRDVQSAKANGCACLVVATGNYPKEVLSATQADVVLADLTDPTPLWRMLELQRPSGRDDP